MYTVPGNTDYSGELGLYGAKKMERLKPMEAILLA